MNSEIECINDLFLGIDNIDECELYLYRIGSGRKKQIMCRNIEQLGNQSILDLVIFIKSQYSQDGSRIGETYEEVRDYDGVMSQGILYRIENKSPLIRERIEHLDNQIVEATTENDVFDYKNGYILVGNCKGKRIKLISVGTPVKQFKNKFMIAKFGNTLTNIDDKVLALKYSIDVAVVGDYTYILSKAAQTFFDFERSYKIYARQCVLEICDSDLISDLENFKKISFSGHNPRKFLSFNKKTIAALQDGVVRERIASKFQIPLTTDGKLDTSSEKGAISVIKLLCNKAMLDPIEFQAREVDGARNWNV